MMTLLAAKLDVPTEAVPHLMASVKSLREALQVMEPWIEAQPATPARQMVKKRIASWRSFANFLERQVIAQEPHR